jgi:hypothetical protein
LDLFSGQQKQLLYIQAVAEGTSPMVIIGRTTEPDACSSSCAFPSPCIPALLDAKPCHSGCVSHDKNFTGKCIRYVLSVGYH